MNKMSRKLMVSILTLTFALLTLGTATFAWFTLTDTATISQFDATVMAGEGIEVSLGEDNPNFFTAVPSEVINAFLQGAGFAGDFRMKHITSADGINFKDLNGDPKTNPKQDGYIEFTLRFRSQQSGINIYLAPGSGLSGAAVNWTADTTFNNGQGTEVEPEDGSIPYYIANAARFSTTSTLRTLVYELPDEAYGDTTDADYGNTVLGTQPGLNGAVHYYNQKHGLNSDLTDENEDGEFDNYTGLPFLSAGTAPSVTTFFDQLPILQLSTTAQPDGYYYGTVVVRIWIEGWDADCFDALYGASLKIDLQFTATQPTASVQP